MFEEIALGIALFSLVVLVWIISKMSDIRKTMNHVINRIDVMSAPAETLTQVTSALQKNMGSLGESIATMNQSITSISTQAMKIETIGKKYEETEELTRRIHSIMIGSYEKGRSGENYLRNTMNELMKMGFVRRNVPIGSKVVEYCVLFNDGKHLPIDSKIVATSDVETLFGEETSDENRIMVRKKIVSRLKNKVNEVSQYINPQVTLPCAVMAIPDSLVGLSADIIPDAVKMNILVVGYSAIPQLIVYFIRVHGFYAIQEDVAELRDRLVSIQQEASKLDDRFFANRFERPMTMLTNATLKVRQTIGSINSVLRLEYQEALEMPEET